MKKLLFLFSIILLINSCSSDEVSNKQDNLRANDPWVFRSVLDQMPRILTMALDSNAWVAYHTDKASLYKVWDGGVIFEGAVYDYAHGPQPSSYGYAYFLNKIESPWVLNSSGTPQEIKMEYKGHKVEADQASLLYEMNVNGSNQKITIQEYPEIKVNEKGQRIFNRVFEVEGLNDNQTIEWTSNVGSIVFQGEIITDGQWTIVEEEKLRYDGKEYLNITGQLALKNGQTQFDVVLETPTIADQNLLEAQLVQESSAPLGLKLIAKNDCKTCHNIKVKTIGPAYEAVANKYADTEDNIKLLSNKVKNGGTGIWGSEVMNAHPGLADDDIEEMIKYILTLGDPSGEQKDQPIEQKEEVIKALTDVEEDNLIIGSIVRTWDIEGVSKFPTSVYSKKPKFAGILQNFDNLNGPDFVDLKENFAMVAEGLLHIEKAGKHGFRIWSDDGSNLYLHGNKVIDNDGNHGTEYKEVTLDLEAGYHPFKLEFYQGLGGKFLSLNYKPESAPAWMVIPVGNLYHQLSDQKTMEGRPLAMSVATKIPGDKNPLVDMHPSFDVAQAKPYEFTPKVGGLDFMSDGRVVVSTWDPKGSVYILSNTTADDPDEMTVKQIASGLAEPLGVKVVDDEIYVMQKQELTKLVDLDGDDITDYYETICDDWGVTANFHEFGFGLEYKDGYFYATLATGILPGGASMPNQHPNRGNAIKIGKDDGSIEFIASGLRTPNGIGLGYNDELYIADNQGDWLPASKIVHLTKGDWFGSRSVDFEGTANLTEKKPVVWLPQDEIGNSPSTPLGIDVGPYKGQMIHGEVTNGGIKRVFVEEVNGELQGAVFRFMQGLDAGVNRIRWAPDGSLYAGGIGNPGNWAQSAKKWFGLQRIQYNKETTFEMLAIRAKSNGIEIEFTEPIKSGEGWNKSDYEIKQWYYKPTIDYGGPKLNEKKLNIRSVNINEDRTKVFLELDGMKEDHVVYVRLVDKFMSETNHSLWATEAWYTMNAIPKSSVGFASRAPEGLNQLNALTPYEKAAGWELLFDGKSMDNFRNFKKEGIGSSWVIKDNAIHLNAVKEEGKWQAKDGGDIITKETYKDFELALEWKISNCGNSGIFFNVVESDDYDYGWQTGPEMQILDNVCHPDTRFPTHRAGDLYDMKACKFVTVNPAGEWNKVNIVSKDGAIKLIQNGYIVVEFNINDESWKSMIANSKFAEWPGFGEAKSGHISLQDHGDPVWFRNIKIRKL